MKDLLLRIGNIFLIIAILCNYNSIIDKRQKAEAKLEGQQKKENIPQLADGEYEGEADGFGDKIRVKVIVQKGAIDNISIEKAPGEDEAYLSMAEKIIPQIIKQQNTDIDIISGATFSSTGIKNAVKQALERARNEED